MQYEYVYVKELKSGQTKTQKQYPIVISDKNERWNLFNGEHVELGKAYTFGYEFSDDKQFKNVRQIIPLANIFKMEVLKELASKSDITRNITVCLSYAKDLATAKTIDIDKMLEWSDKLYDYVTQKCDTEYDKINDVKPSPKDVK